MANRSDLRGYVRNYLYEDTADLFSDAKLNQALDEARIELPLDGIYQQVISTTSLVVDQLDYSLPSNTIEVEAVEVDEGTSTKPEWVPLNGWEEYGGALWLKSRPTSTDTIRIKTRRGFTALSDDVTDTDVPDNKIPIWTCLAAIKAYEMFMGYFTQAKNWDAIAKPDGIDLTKIIAWIRELKQKYNKMVDKFKEPNRPQDINLVD